MTADQRFRQHERVGLDRDYQAAFRARLRKSAGPLTVFGRANDLDCTRLGLSIGRKVGNAVVRTTLKRRLREAFRLNKGDLPAGFDLVVTSRPHAPLPLTRYASLLADAASKIADEHARRVSKEAR
ncbi:MAG: ribonuclease P protein component [Planctomycetota bacterium]